MHSAESSSENSVGIARIMTSQAQNMVDSLLVHWLHWFTQLINYVIGQAFCAYIQIFVSTGYLIKNSSLSMLPFWEWLSPVMCYVHIIISTYYFNIMGCYQILCLWVVFILSYVCQDYSICQIELQNYHARMGARKLLVCWEMGIG
jgi:uncharacterized membrane protein YdcZ (DUF606 family)